MAARLDGIRALVTRPAVQGEALCAAIRAEGGAACSLPLIEIEPLPAASVAPQLHALDTVDIAIFVSSNAVRIALERLDEAGCGWPATVAALAIGTSTRAALARAGIEAQAGADAMDSEELLRHSLLASIGGRRVLLVKGEGGRGVLAAELRARGAEISECVLYRRTPAAVTAPALAALLARERINVALAASGETLQALLGLLRAGAAGTIAGHLRLVVPGQRVAAMAAQAGLAGVEIAANATDAAMLDVLARLAPRLRARTENG
jgi:uroporphyrinogen-III synthase